MNDVCRSPYCECPVGKCAEGRVDARGEPVSEREQLRQLKDRNITLAAENATMRQSIQAMSTKLAKLEAQRRNQRRELRSLQRAYKAVLAAITYQLGGPGFGGNLTGRLDDDLRARGATPAEGAALPTWIVPASMMGMTIHTDKPVPMRSEEAEVHVAPGTITGADAETGEPVDIPAPPADGVRIVVGGEAYDVRPETGGEQGACTGCAFVEDGDLCAPASKRYDCSFNPVIFVKAAT